MKTRKKKRQYRFINGTKGAISILLCLLLTPFLTITLGLVEYGRYQSLIEVTDEIMELTGFSALTDYDKYLHDRFGLLALSQNDDQIPGAELLEYNAKILGKQISFENGMLTGMHALSDDDILKRQIIDVSEMSGSAAVLLKDFKLEELLNALSVSERFKTIMNTVNSLAKLTDELNNAVDAGKAFESELQNIINKIDDAERKANTLATNMANLIQKLAQNGVRLPQNATKEQLDAFWDDFATNYLEDVKLVYGGAKELIDALKAVKTGLTNIKTAGTKFVNAVKAARQAVSGIGSSGSENGDKATDKAKTTLEDVLGELEDIVDETMDAIKDDAINTAKNTVQQIIDTSLESIGLADAAARYNQIFYGDYFDLPLSDMARNDLIEILNCVPAVWNDGDYTRILQELKNKLVPDIKIDFRDLKGALGDVLDAAAKELKDGVGEKLVDLLTKLTNIVRNLFDLDVFYEPDMNAYVNIAYGPGERSGYQTFLDAIAKMFKAIETFTKAMKDKNIITAFVKILKATKELLEAIAKLLEAIWKIATETVSSIATMVTGGVKRLYEKIVIAGYMRHNLPSRRSSGKLTGSYESGQAKFQIALNGTGLTGYSYNNIARPSTYVGGTDNANNGFKTLGKMIKNLQNGYGTDTMFKGAELEYIRAGTNSEVANQVIVFFDIYFMRLLLDVVSVFSDPEVASVAAAATIASWAVYLLYLIIEPFCDTLLLVNGEQVPLIKMDCYLTGTGVTGFLNKLANVTMGEALRNSIDDFAKNNAGDSGGNSNTQNKDSYGVGEISYETHVLILLMIHVKDDTMITRLRHIIDLEASEYYKSKFDFSLDKAYTAVEVSAAVTFYPFFDLGLYNNGSSYIPKVEMRLPVSY